MSRRSNASGNSPAAKGIRAARRDARKAYEQAVNKTLGKANRASGVAAFQRAVRNTMKKSPYKRK